jgi:hypothetical protein
MLSFINVQKILHVTSFFWMADGPFVEYLGLFDTPVSYNTVGNIDFAAAVLASLKEINTLGGDGNREYLRNVYEVAMLSGNSFFFHGADYGGSGLEFQTFRESSADFCRDTGPIGIWCCACRDWPFSSAFKPIDLGLGFKVH